MKKILNFLSWNNMVGKMKVLKVLKVERLNLSGACELMSPPFTVGRRANFNLFKHFDFSIFLIFKGFASDRISQIDSFFASIELWKSQTWENRNLFPICASQNRQDCFFLWKTFSENREYSIQTPQVIHRIKMDEKVREIQK